MTESNKNRAYLEGLKKLRKLITNDYTDGGWLPPGREMCNKFNINRLTYRKAVKRLVDEGTAISIERKGHYIQPDYLRTIKVGLVLGNGEESPVISGLSSIYSSLSMLEKDGITINLIQASPLHTLASKALTHAVSCLIWFYPPQSSYPVIEKIALAEELQIIVVPFFDPAGPENIISNAVPTVTLDYQHLGKSRADFLAQRGHKNIAYVGNYWFAEYTKLVNNLQENGIPFTPDHCLNNNDALSTQLPELISTKNITAILSEGNEERLAKVFEVLSNIPENKRPELVIRNPKTSDALYKKFPTIKPIAIEKINHQNIGEAAGKLIYEQLKTGVPLKSQKIKAYNLLMQNEECKMQNGG